MILALIRERKWTGLWLRPRALLLSAALEPAGLATLHTTLPQPDLRPSGGLHFLQEEIQALRQVVHLPQGSHPTGTKLDTPGASPLWTDELS